MQRYPEVDGARLRQLRLERVLSQRELCLLAGVSQDALSKLENERRAAHPSTIRKLAEVLGVEPTELTKAQNDHT